MGKEHLNLIDYTAVFIRWRKLIVINFLVVCLITAAVSLIIPKWYRAWSTLLPPSDETALQGLGSLIGDLPFGGFGLNAATVSDEANRFIAITQSRTVMESVAAKFGLQERYGAENMEETVRLLREHVFIDITDEGTISLGAEAGTPYFAGPAADQEARVLASDMTNFLVDELDQVNKRLKTEQAVNFRRFIEGRYEQNLEELTRAEDAFKAFQSKNGMIALPEQTIATINAASDLKAQIIAKEVELGVLEGFLGSSHNQMLQLQSELRELRKNFDKFISVRTVKTKEGSADVAFRDLFVPLEELPDMGLQYARLYREVLIQEKIQEFLMPQFEQAKINEARDTPTLQVLDEAVAPVKRARPRRMILVILAGFLSLLLSSALIFSFEYWRRIKDEGGAEYDNLNRAISDLKRDFRRRRQ